MFPHPDISVTVMFKEFQSALQKHCLTLQSRNQKSAVSPLKQQDMKSVGREHVVTVMCVIIERHLRHLTLSTQMEICAGQYFISRRVLTGWVAMNETHPYCGTTAWMATFKSLASTLYFYVVKLISPVGSTLLFANDGSDSANCFSHQIVQPIVKCKRNLLLSFLVLDCNLSNELDILT
ncbi:hypothetical protein J6590_064044 [Homalodisca vitripennis]|nr:hypothetical protein J6590_064044 [Homalodisca vitripennis]